MRLQRLRQAGVPMGPLTVRESWLRPAKGAGKYHADRRCHRTKADLYQTTITLTDVPDDRFCWACALHPDTSPAREYYEAALTVLNAVEQAAKLAEQVKDGRVKASDVAAAEAYLRQCEDALAHLGNDELTGWAAAHLATLADLRTDLHRRCPVVSDPQLPMRMLASAVAAGKAHPRAVSAATGRRDVPALEDGAFPALRGPRFEGCHDAGQGKILTQTWAALTQHFLTHGDIPAAAAHARQAAHEQLAGLPGPQLLAQVPLDTPVPTGAGSVGEALTGVWRSAAAAEVDAVVDTFAATLTTAQQDVHDSPMVTCPVTGWDPQETPLRVRAAAPLLRAWPVVCVGDGPALMHAPMVVFSWLARYGFVPEHRGRDGQFTVRAGRPIDGGDADTIETLEVALRLLPTLPPLEPPARWNDARPSPVERALTVARHALSETA